MEERKRRRAGGKSHREKINSRRTSNSSSEEGREREPFAYEKLTSPELVGIIREKAFRQI